MKDGYVLKTVAIGGVALCYAAYLCWSPDPHDGLLFGSVIGAISLLAGVNIGEKITQARVLKVKK